MPPATLARDKPFLLMCSRVKASLLLSQSILTESDYHQLLENTMPCLGTATLLVMGESVDCRRETGNIITRRALKIKPEACRRANLPPTIRLWRLQHRRGFLVTALFEGQGVGALLTSQMFCMLCRAASGRITPLHTLMGGYWDNGRENGNYYLRFRVPSPEP